MANLTTVSVQTNDAYLFTWAFPDEETARKSAGCLISSLLAKPSSLTASEHKFTVWINPALIR